MKKTLFLALFLMSPMILMARGRGSNVVTPTYTDNGDTFDTNAITVGTTTPVNIFASTSTQAINYRSIMFQNVSTGTYRVYIGTHSAISTTSGGRWFIPAGGSWTTNAKGNLWALFEPTATGTLQVLMEAERDNSDAPITGY